jgi:hypothetical protein
MALATIDKECGLQWWRGARAMSFFVVGKAFLLAGPAGLFVSEAGERAEEFIYPLQTLSIFSSMFSTMFSTLVQDSSLRYVISLLFWRELVCLVWSLDRVFPVLSPRDGQRKWPRHTYSTLDLRKGITRLLYSQNNRPIYGVDHCSLLHMTTSKLIALDDCEC